MAQRRVLARDARTAEERPQVAADVHRGVDVDHLAEADLLGTHTLLRVLELTEVGGEQRDLRVLAEGLRELLLRDLERGDRAVELDAGARVLDRREQGVAGGAGDAEDDAEARLGQARQRRLEALRLRQHRILGEADVVEDDLTGDRGAQGDLAVDLRGLHSLGVRGDDEAADDRAALLIGVLGLGPHDHDIGDRRVRDPHLRAVEDPVGSVPARRRLHARGVGADIGFGEAEAAQSLAGGHLRQPFLLLLLGSVAVDGEHRERTLHGHERAQTGVDGLELPAGEPVLRGRRPTAAVAVEVHAEDAELSEAFGEFTCGNGRIEEVVADLLPHVLIEPLADDVREFEVIGVEDRIQSQDLVGAHRCTHLYLSRH